MLVLSRRLNEKIVFPGINTTVQIVSVKPGLVRLGIEAPAEVAVLREELARRTGPDSASEALSSGTRQRLEAVGTCLSLLRLQLEGGRSASAEETIGQIEQELQALRRQVEQPTARHAAIA
jgi:carbon storage regulator CsrA